MFSIGLIDLGRPNPNLEPELLAGGRDLQRSRDCYRHPRSDLASRDDGHNIKGNTYRLKEKIKAGLIRDPEVQQNVEAGVLMTAISSLYLFPSWPHNYEEWDLSELFQMDQSIMYSQYNLLSRR